MAYQDYFSTGGPKPAAVAAPDFGRASGDLKKTFTFDPLDAPFFKRDAYSAGSSFGENIGADVRKPSGFGSGFGAYKP